MGVSKKKRLYIKRNYPGVSLDKLAADTNLGVVEIQKILGKDSLEQKITLSQVLDNLLCPGIMVAVFLAPFIMLPWLRDASNLPQNGFIQVSILFLALVWALKGIIDGELKFLSSPLIWPLICFSVWCLISVFIARNPFEAVPILLQTLALVVCFVLVQNVYYKEENFDRLVWTLFLAGGGIACIGLLQHLFDFSMIPQARPPAATFSNRNMASQFMVLVFPFGVYLFLKTSNTFTSLSAAFLSVLILVYVVYIKSLAAWISIALELAVLSCTLLYLNVAGKRDFQLKSRLAPMAVMAVLFLLLINIDSGGMNLKFGGVSEQMVSVREFVQPTDSSVREKKNAGSNDSFNDSSKASSKVSSKVSSIEWRWSVWRNSMVMVRDNLLTGVGAGNFMVEYPLYNHAVMKDQKFSIEFQPVRAHNDYVQAAAEFGLTGFLIIMSAVFCFFYILLVVIRGHLPGKNLFLAATLLTAGSGIILNAGFSFPFQRAVPPFILILISALAGVLYVRAKNYHPIKITNTRTLYSIAVMLAFFLGYLTYYNYSMVQFDKFYGRAIQNYNQGRWTQVLIEADRAIAHSSQKKDILFYKGYASYKLGNIEESINYYTQLLHYYPNYINGLINLGVDYEKLGQDENAVKMYEKIVQILPYHAGYHNNLGHHLQKMGRLEQAYGYFKKAVDLDVENPVIQLNYGTVCLLLKKFSLAKTAFEKALAIKPGWEKPMQYLKFIESHHGGTE